MISVVASGLGPAGPELISSAVHDRARIVDHVVLRTTRHPAATAFSNATSCDDLYDSARRIEDVYEGVLERLVGLGASGTVLYLVPGSPLVAERTVELLRADPRVELEVLPSLSFLDFTWSSLGIDPFAAGVRLVDGHRFASEAAGERGPLLVGQCDDRQVLSDIKLSVDEGPEVTVLQRLGLPDEEIRAVDWADLDRSFEPDHLTSLWIPQLASPVGAEIQQLISVMDRLRVECPWDAEQTHESLIPYLREEAEEAIEAIGEMETSGSAHFEEELGDVLLQVVFHAKIASEQGEFDLTDVAKGLREKLVRRHPHVFGDESFSSAGEVQENWERLKAAERAQR